MKNNGFKYEVFLKYEDFLPVWEIIAVHLIELSQHAFPQACGHGIMMN